MLNFQKILLGASLISALFCAACSDAAYDRIPERIEGYEGVTLFVFHTSWCSYCNAELPLVKKIYADYSPCGLHVIGINEDDDEKIMKEFVREKQIPYPVVYWDFQLMKKFGHPRAIPTHFLIDSSGSIKLREVGPLNDEIVRSQIERALGDAAKNCRP